MFHCNGWCFTWAVTAAGATHCACARSTRPDLGAAPHAGRHPLQRRPDRADDDRQRAGGPAAPPLARPVQVATGGAPPSPALLARMAGLGFEVTHLYGLTETFGPVGDLRLAAGVGRAAARGAGRCCRRGRASATSSRSGSGWSTRTGGTCPPTAPRIGEVVLPRQQRDARLLPGRGGDRRGGPGRLVPHRRPGGDAPRRLRRDPRPRQGRHHLRRREHRLGRGGAGDRPPSRGARGRPWSGVPDDKWGEAAVAFVDAPPRRPHHRGRAHRARPRPARPLQGATGGNLVAELPKTSTGKIQKYVLREQARAQKPGAGGPGSLG